MSTLPQTQAHPHFWLGFLTTAMGEAARMDTKESQTFLRKRLAEFVASPAPSEELREQLRRYLK